MTIRTRTDRDAALEAFETARADLVSQRIELVGWLRELSARLAHVDGDIEDIEATERQLSQIRFPT